MAFRTAWGADETRRAVAAVAAAAQRVLDGAATRADAEASRLVRERDAALWEHLEGSAPPDAPGNARAIAPAGAAS